MKGETWQILTLFWFSSYAINRIVLILLPCIPTHNIIQIIFNAHTHTTHHPTPQKSPDTVPRQVATTIHVQQSERTRQLHALVAGAQQEKTTRQVSYVYDPATQYQRKEQKAFFSSFRFGQRPPDCKYNTERTWTQVLAVQHTVRRGKGRRG